MGKLNDEKKAMLAATLAYTIFGLICFPRWR